MHRPSPSQSDTGTSAQRLDERVAQALLLDAPSAVLIDSVGNILRFCGRSMEGYLAPARSDADNSLFSLLRDPLKPVVRQSLDAAMASNPRPHIDTVPVSIDGYRQMLRIATTPLPGTPDGADTLWLVSLAEAGKDSDDSTQAIGFDRGPSTALRDPSHDVHELQEELRAARAGRDRAEDHNQTTLAEFEAVNEELQSANQELESSKEEMQSINEELHILNDELIEKNDRLISLNSDLRNLLESTQIATVFLDKTLRIKNFTPRVAELFRLRESDLGRPITDLVSRLDYDALETDARHVLDALTLVEREVSSYDGRVFIMRMRLYRTVEDVIDGVVITFFDISDRRQFESQRARLAAIVESSHDAIVSQNLDLCITSWNAAAEQIFGYEAETAIGQHLSTLLAPLVDEPALPMIDRTLQATQTQELAICVSRGAEDIHLALTVAPIVDAAGAVFATSIVARDITEHVAHERSRNLLLQELNHRVKNVLATVQSILIKTVETDLASFRASFSKRIHSLARTHDLLAQDNGPTVTLDCLLETQLRPYDQPGTSRWSTAGNRTELATDQALALGMVLHELTTNAVKHGALSSPAGCISVCWQIQNNDDNPRLTIDWTESGGAPISEPAREGFGLQLIREGLAHQLDAEVILDFRPAGLRCTLAIPHRAPAVEPHR